MKVLKNLKNSTRILKSLKSKMIFGYQKTLYMKLYLSKTVQTSGMDGKIKTIKNF